MAELHSNFYFKHPDSATHQQLVAMFRELDLRSKKKTRPATEKSFVRKAILVCPDRGETLALNLLEKIHTEFGESLQAESIERCAGYCVSHWVNGSSGAEIQQALIEFISALCPTIRAQSWGCGDDEPWEYWLKNEDGCVFRFDDAPFDDNDDKLKGTVYRWWHEGLPASIKAGFLNDSDYADRHKNSTNVTDTQYVGWLENLKKQRSADPENQQPQEFDQVGPSLIENELAGLRQICSEVLARENASLDDYVRVFARLSSSLHDLERRYQSGVEIVEDAEIQFLLCCDCHDELLRQGSCHEFLCMYLKSVAQQIHGDNLLGRLILRHNEACIFVGELVGFCQSELLEEMYPREMTGFHEFLDWKNRLVSWVLAVR